MKRIVELWNKRCIEICVVIGIVAVAMVWCGCSEVNDLLGIDKGCLRADEPQAPFANPDKVLRPPQESHEGRWTIIYVYNCLEEQYQEFVYSSEDECSDWHLINHVKDICR